MKTLWKFFKAVFIITLCCVLLICFIQKLQGVHHPKIFGYGFGFVVSGSMEPNLPAGSFIIIHEEDFKENDVITYNHYSGRSVTHRVIEVNGDTVKTQGDANNTSDPEFSSGDVIGKVICHFNMLWIIVPLVIYAIFAFIYAIIPEREDMKDA